MKEEGKVVITLIYKISNYNINYYNKIMTIKVALITGITGQDGSYLAELLLEKKYQVWGIIRRSSNFNTQRIEHLYHNKNLILKYGDLSDSGNLLHIFYQIKESYWML